MKDLLANGIFPQPLDARKCKCCSLMIALLRHTQLLLSSVLMFHRSWSVRLSTSVFTVEFEFKRHPVLAIACSCFTLAPHTIAISTSYALPELPCHEACFEDTQVRSLFRSLDRWSAESGARNAGHVLGLCELRIDGRRLLRSDVRSHREMYDISQVFVRLAVQAVMIVIHFAVASDIIRNGRVLAVNGCCLEPLVKRRLACES